MNCVRVLVAQSELLEKPVKGGLDATDADAAQNSVVLQVQRSCQGGVQLWGVHTWSSSRSGTRKYHQ